MTAETSLTHLAPEPSDPVLAGFWTQVGQGVMNAACAVVRGVQTAFYAVDPDVRRDIAQAPLLAVTLLAPGYKAPTALPDDGRRPVVFVHGLGGHRGNFLYLHGWLRTRGHRRCYAVGFPDGGRLPDLGRELADFIHQVADVNGLGPDDSIDIVTHSMGGLIARLALDDLAVAARVGTVVTLGTPHRGTHAARFAGTDHTFDLRPDSELMARLRCQEPWNRGPRMVCFWSTSDPLMQPSETAQVTGAENREVPGMSHINYLVKPAAWKAVAEVLAQPG
jgi:triacylglycerol lipase